MTGGFDLTDYNTVAERLQDFRALYPAGCLQAEIVTVPPPFSDHFLAVRAFAYRDPEDQRPGTGLAWEPMPGKTSFTRDSELQNAETAAWGRAIIAVLASDTKKGIASREEVQFRRADQESLEGSRRTVFAHLNELGITDRGARLEWASDVLRRRVVSFTNLSQADYSALLDWLGPGEGDYHTRTAGDVGESTVTRHGATHRSDPEAGQTPPAAAPQGRGGERPAAPQGRGGERGQADRPPPLVHPPPSSLGHGAQVVTASDDGRTELTFRIAAAHAAWAKSMPKGAEAWLNGFLAHVNRKKLDECSLQELEAGWDWLVALHRDK